MPIPGFGQLTALAFLAAIDDPSRIHRSRDVWAISTTGEVFRTSIYDKA
jgi:hypothetical protein